MEYNLRSNESGLPLEKRILEYGRWCREFETIIWCEAS